MLLSHVEPLMEQQIVGVYGLQQSALETEALSQGLEALYQSLLQAMRSEKKRDNQRCPVFLFEKKLGRFSKKLLRVSLERGLIFDKVKVFFAKKPEPIRSRLRVDLGII